MGAELKKKKSRPVLQWKFGVRVYQARVYNGCVSPFQLFIVFFFFF